MNYIKGHITIYDQLKNLASRGVCYYGAVDTEILEEIPFDVLKVLAKTVQKDIPMAESISCPITSMAYDVFGNEREIGRNCVFIYPKTCNKLNAVYTQEAGNNSPINIIPAWSYFEVVVGDTPCYLYYQTMPTKDINLYYQFVFNNGREE